jgi:hypothetical protein
MYKSPESPVKEFSGFIFDQKHTDTFHPLIAVIPDPHCFISNGL